MDLLCAVIHLALSLHYGYGIKIYLYGLDPPEDFLKIRLLMGGPFKYLTFWDMLIQFAYFTLAFVNDVVGSNTAVIKKQTSLQQVRDYVFSTVVFSCGAFVTVSFWGIYNIDRNLIFPPIFDSWFPLWLNHNVHTTPLVSALIELCMNPHIYPRRRTGFSVVAFFSLCYLAWVCYIAYVSGHWVYPILGHFSVVGRVVFIGSMSILVSLFYVVGDAINNKIWGMQAEAKKVEAKKID